MIFSRSTQYAIQALVRIAETKEGEYMTVEELGDELGIPNEFLAKLLQRLTKHGFLDSRKGRGGGFKLARGPDTIDLHEVLEVFEGPDSLLECIFDGKICREKDHHCPLHEEWSEIREEIIDFTHTNNIKDLAEK